MKRLLLLLFVSASAFAQEYSNDFQSQSSTADWIGAYKTHPDPLDPKNVVFGTKEPARDGSFATLTAPRFGGRFEYRGRFLRTHEEARLGIAFFSSMPDREAYYLIALSGGGGKRRAVRSNATGADFTMQLSARGGGAPTGTLDSDVRIDVNRWYEFLIEADEFDHATHIRARFWPAGTPEPDTFQIEARDPSVWRLNAGRIALWSAVRGDVYFDNIAAKSISGEEVTIGFFDAETQQELDRSKLALFKKPARIDVRVSGDPAPLIRLDGAAYTGGPIATDGMHEITVQAGFVTASLRLLVDQVPPALVLLGNGAPLADGKVFGNDVTVDARVTDVSRVTLTSNLGALPLPLAQESPHSITVTATDQVGWTSSQTATFTIDKTAPVVTLLGNGVPFLPGHTFNQDVTLTWTAADATLDTVVATLNGNAIASGTVVSAEAVHAVVVTATDRAGHNTRVARDFVLRRGAPEVRLLANGAPLAEKTYGAAVAITADFIDPTPVTHAATLDGQTYTLGTAISAEGRHTFAITARNAAGLETTIGPLTFGVDVTKPVLALSESGAPFTDGMKFNRDVLPQLTVTDNLTATPSLTLLVNGVQHAIGAKIAEERAEHVISATATDEAGHVATIGPFRFVLDKTRPVVTITEPKGDLFAKPVQVKVTVDDLTTTTLSATLGGTPIDLDVPIAANGTHRLSVTATDAVGWQSEPATASFTIDTLAPAIRFTSPGEVTTPLADVTGFADDAVSIVINGRAAQVDVVSKTFALQDVVLAEGANDLAVVATDRAGNVASTQQAITLDTRAPELLLTAPAANACLDAKSVEVRGVAVDRRIATVKVNGAEATLTNGTFTATVPFANEGAFVITVEAIDGVGHIARATLPITIDRTAPVVDVTEGSELFTATLLNRPVALFPRITDADGAPRVTATLNGQPYAAGTAITADKVHQLTIVATDCAGHSATKTITFEIDRTAPSILTFVPKNESKLGAKPQITGTTSPDAASITVEPGGRSYAVANGAFTLAGVPLGHGVNTLRLTVTDRAGNAGEETYTLTLDLSTPSVEIVESGVPIPPNALFARDVTPVIRASESDATIAATLNGSAFTSGTKITAAGSYTLLATASDAFGHTSAQATATFTIDRDAPAIDITAPANGAYTAEELIEVRGTVNGADVQSVVVNATRATVANGAFSATVPVEFGPNVLVATAMDRAGNASSDQVEITRGTGPLAIVLTAPFNGAITNRRTTVVAGQILTAAPDAKVTLNGIDIAVDPGGFFRKTDFALTEGENVITAAVVNGAGERNQASVRVTADLTPPRVRLLESGQPLADGARFAERAVITVESSDGVPQLVVDSDVAPTSTTIDEEGGHTLVATARDAAGNETRVERTIFIGGAGSGACRLSDFDPVHGSIVTSSTVTISGRTGGAGAVTVNGTPAVVANGSFCATVELPVEGDNSIVIACEGAGEPQTLVLRRVTNEPSIAIDLPAEGSVSVNETIAVRGSVSGAVTVDVNGAPATLNGGTWSAPNVRLASGLNVLVARARAASGRTVATSRRVLYLKDAPAVTITSPAASVVAGSNRIDVSGGWSNVDPSTITVNGSAATAKTLSDTTGTFAAANVALLPGTNTITVTARDAANRTATATVVVTLTAGNPSVTITEPADNAVFSAESPETFTVRGTFNAAAGSTVEVAGETATIDGANFAATVRHAAGRVTPVLVRVTTPEGEAGIDAVRVTRLTARPKVLEHFPAANAFDVDPGAMPVVLFSMPMELVSTREAFRLESAAGSPVSGAFRVDRDVVTFAPAALLTPGERYTIRIATTAKSIGGDALEAAVVTSFTVASTAGTRAPTLDPIAAGCAQRVSIGGTAPPNARLRIDLGTLTFTATANAAGAWSFQLPAGGSSGYQVVRVRVAGSDGSLSPAAESCFLVDCAGPRVVSAAYDRAANRLTITFTKEVKPPASDAIVLRLTDNRVVGATFATETKTVVVTPSEDLTRKTFTLSVTTAIEDLSGAKLSFPFTQAFPYDADAPPPAGDGSGFMSGEVFDAETGRPLAGASVFVDVTGTPLVTDARGRYAAQLPEGAHTLRVSANGYSSVWRQIIIPPGAGVIPIDVRLTPIGQPIDAQSLPGLLPLGWSPLAAKLATAAGTLEFTVPAAEITANAQVLTVVRYYDDRDEWRVLTAAANIVGGKVTVPADEPGAYALVYPDKAPQLARPPTPANGAVLTGVADPCAQQPCALEAESFVLAPPVILPTGKTVAMLKIKGATVNFPSGTAVQAYIDEELRLADGSRVTDPPFTTDLLLYRNLAGTLGIAEFRLGPSPRAAEVILDVGFNHIRILPYPGRLDRGTLVGPEGGRVPGDGRVTVEIPAGATTEAMRATTATIDDLAQFGTIGGFTIVGGFTLTLQLARTVTQPDGLNSGDPELLQSAKATFPNAGPGQYILVEVLDGPRFRLAAQMEALSGNRITTRPIDRALLPLDGVIREGRYLLLKADAPIAFATGLLRDPNGLYLRDARIAAPPLGVTDVTRITGTYALPVQAAPAAPFTLIPGTNATGDGAPYTHATAPAQDAVVRVDFALQAVAPRLVSTEPGADATEVSLTAFVKAHFDIALDATSIADSITVTDDAGAVVDADILLETPQTILWRLRGGENRLAPNRAYTVTISPSIRGANRTPFGRTHRFRFRTITQLASNEIHPEKIRITVPDANGHARVIGAAGALPAGFIALVTRRGRDFTTVFQAQAAADGSFTIDITEPVALSDVIDLQVLNAARAIAAILPLTPFVTEDGRGFVAPTDRTVTFHGDLATVTVAAGSFDTPTLVTTASAPQTNFTQVPGFEAELPFHTGITIDFDGVAKKPLEIDLPVTTATDGKTFYLARLSDSSRGLRMEIDDTLSVANGKFTTRDVGGNNLRIGGQSVFTGTRVKDHLLRISRPGDYAVVEIAAGGITFVGTQSAEANLEIFLSHWNALYCSMEYLTASRGRAVFPVRAGEAFTVDGVDGTSGLSRYRTSYEGVPLAPAGDIWPIASPRPNDSGPYPVYARPLFVHIADLHAEDVKQVPAGGIEVTLPANTGEAVVTRTREHPREFGLLNIRGGYRPPSAEPTRNVIADLGDRLLIFGTAENVVPTRDIELVFNEAIDTASLEEHIVLEKREGEDWQPVPVTFRIDSNGRRVWLDLGSEMQRGAEYRAILRSTLRDVADSPRELGVDLVLPFTVRKPHGDLLGAPFSLPDGSVRDLALDGNLLFVSASEGDLLAYDVSDPAALATKPPIARASAKPEAESESPVDIPGETWAVTVDHHGRIWTTAQTDRFGVIRSFRVEDFAKVPPPPVGGVTRIRPVTQVAASIVSWRPGANANLPLGTTWLIQSDRAEAIPRKLHVALQDESFEAVAGDDFLFGNNTLDAVPNFTGRVGEFAAWRVIVPRSPAAQSAPKFRRQRVTVHNQTANLRWSVDVPEGEEFATLTGVLSRPGDRLKVMRNVGTYAVVALLGYGIGFYDLNAIEHNRRLPVVESSRQFAEQLALTEGRRYDPRSLKEQLCDEPSQQGGLPCGPRTLTWVSDAVAVPALYEGKPLRFDLFALETRKGLVDVSVERRGGREATGDGKQDAWREAELAFTGSYGNGAGLVHNDHPRLVKIRKAFREEGRTLNARFTGLARFDDAQGNPFALVAAQQFGILVVDLKPPLSYKSLASVIWIPAGAYGVRHIAGTHYATAVDGEGRSLLIDLQNIDEREDVLPIDIDRCPMPCDTLLFPIVRKALAAGPDPAGAVRFGSDDPRILWKSAPDPDNLYGTLAPVADPDTGMIYSGELLQETVRVLAGLEPRIRIAAKTLAEAPMQAVSAIVPLGVQPPKPGEKEKHERGGFGAFRVEVSLPGSMGESHAGTLRMRVESERVPGLKIESWPAGWPEAHADLLLRRAIPDPSYRFQKGWNLFVSEPLIVAADPRATKAYKPAWGTTTYVQKELAGCFQCEAPAWAAAHPEARELYSYGRRFTIRALRGAFDGPYAWVTERLQTTLGTVMADTVRPKSVLVAGQNPPVAGGLLQETTYLHSGELETAAVDLVAGGRAGWDVALGRIYRSRTLGWSPLGFGWDSPLFKRLRALPGGSVEYRDGAEVWLFTRDKDHYTSPRGLFLKLTRDESGWTLIDQQWRITRFNDLGRVISESDEFVDPLTSGSGNTIRYAYDEREQLAAVIDPTGRKTSFTYDESTGYLKEVTDWRGRVVKYDVAGGTLGEVTLPVAKAGEGVPAEFDHSSAPRIRYGYAAAAATFADRIELQNLTSITDPDAVERGGPARVQFAYGDPSSLLHGRDRVVSQTWGTGESATFTYSAENVVTKDALGQTRTYTLASGGDERMHFASITEHGVPLITVAEGAIPERASVDEPYVTRDLTTTFGKFGYNGELLNVTHPNGRVVKLEWKPAEGPGVVLQFIRDYATELVPLVTHIDRDTAELAANTILAMARGPEGTPPVKRPRPSPSRARREVVREDEGIRETTKYNEFGQVTSAAVSDENGNDPIETQISYYTGPHSNLLLRGRPFRISTGDTRQSFTYTAAAGNGEEIEVRDWSRGTIAKTVLDSHDRTVRATVTTAGGEVLSDERFGYDESGRLAYHARRQKPLGLVETRIRYDAVGRSVETSMTSAVVGGAPATIVTTTEYDLANRKITRSDPAVDGETPSAHEETLLDGLGRPTTIARRAGTTAVQRVLGYDIHGRQSYESDNVRSAVLRQHDLFGREKLSLTSDGMEFHTVWNPWNERVGDIAFGSDGHAFARSKQIVTSQGRLRAVNQELAIGAAARQVRFDWKGARLSSTRVGLAGSINDTFPTGPYRTEQVERDLSGRVHIVKTGETTTTNSLLTDAEKIWSQTETTYIGTVPSTVVTSEPRASASYTTRFAYDGLDRPTHVIGADGAYTTRSVYDEAGNVVELQRPGMNAETAAFDARGLPLETVLADGAKIKFVYDARGVLRQRIDEAGESTFYDTDDLGRVVKVRYADDSFEQTVYEAGTGAVKATRDRGGQWLSYTYDGGGRVTSVRNGEDPAVAPQLVIYEYDPAGRLSRVKNEDAGIAFEDYDFLGRPRLTRTFRYAAGSGPVSPVILDMHTQTHAWSIHDGEREEWRMPVNGDVRPEATPAWLQRIVETRDAGGNLVAQKTAAGRSLLEADGRSIGRLKTRTRFTPDGHPIATAYGYADGTSLASPVELPRAASIPNSGLPLWSHSTFGAVTLAGSAALRDDAMRLAAHRDLATSRLSGWSYDDRGRMTESLLAKATLAAAPTVDTLIHADFRAGRTIPALFTPAEHELLGAEAAKLEPLSWTQTKTDALHQAKKRTLLLDGEVTGQPVDYLFNLAGRRLEGGGWTSVYDEFGRLASITSANRRIEYLWDPNNRLIGRIAKQPAGEGGWRLEDRGDVLARDGLPADTTFVWDPIVDRLVSIFAAGADPAAGPDSGLLRQYLHGDNGYDDPTRVVIAGTTWFPIFDETAAGSLTAVAGPDGNLAERVLYADAYGDAPRYLHGPVVDSITTEIRKTTTGALASVKIRVHLSEAIAIASLVDGVRLSATRADGTVAYTSGVAPSLEDRFTALWTLTPTDWTALTTAPSAESLEVAVTCTLHAEAWGNTPVMPLPPWSRTLYPHTASTPTHPVIVREPLASLRTFAETIGAGEAKTRTGWRVGDLYAVAAAESKTKLWTGFKAAPFVEPGTGLVYLRDRWYDASMGTFLTPDRAGYLDSSNLYVGFAGDPVNNFDPTGECIGLDEIDCADHAIEYWSLFVKPREWGGTAKRSLRFFGYELKGAALAIPRLIKGLYDVATHLPETAEAIGNLGTAIANDPVGMLQAGGNAIVNADPDAVAEFTGETLFFAGVGAAAKTPQMANALRGTATAVGTGDIAADTARTAQRARVLANLAESRAARRASRFGEYGRNDNLYRQFLRIAETGDFSTPYNRAIFSSGRRAPEVVAEFMRVHPGYFTIEKTAAGSILDAARLYERLPFGMADSIWRTASARYAAAASGRVHLFDRYARAGRILMDIERPTLMANRRVWGLVHHWNY